VVVAFAWLQALRYAQDAATGGALAVGAMALAVLLVVVFALLWNLSLALRTAGLVALVGLSLLGWSNGSWLNYFRGPDLREPARPSYVTPDAARLAENLERASWAKHLDPFQMSVVVDPSLRPVLAWPLRERLDVRWARAEGELEEDAVIVPSGGAPAFGPASYVGQTYALAGRWQPAFAGRHELVGWLLQRREVEAESASSVGPAFERADLYLRVE
jgi:hypothetical protein